MFFFGDGDISTNPQDVIDVCLQSFGIFTGAQFPNSVVVVSDGEESSNSGPVFLRKKLDGGNAVVIMAGDMLDNGFDLCKAITSEEYDQLVLASTA